MTGYNIVLVSWYGYHGNATAGVGSVVSYHGNWKLTMAELSGRAMYVFVIGDPFVICAGPL